jgi:general stress protein 26
MRDAPKTIGNLIDHQKIAFIASIDSDGFPNMKAMLTQLRARMIANAKVQESETPA